MLSIITTDGELYLEENFISADTTDEILNTLISKLQWHEETIKLFGKSIKSPRLVCWYGDSGADYCYSGISHKPKPWIPELSEILEKIQQHTGYDFNAVLANLYRNGNDSMGWHADKEPELGTEPILASLSLGETRVFKIRHKKTKKTHSVELNSGSLLLMSGKLQQHWQHSVPKSKRRNGSRINLSFRRIVHLCQSDIEGTDSMPSRTARNDW